MAELRRDPVTGRWVCLAPGRALRPEATATGVANTQSGVEDCPFCEGHEQRTPPEVAAVRPDGNGANSPGWRVRVVPNLFPAFSDEDVPADLGNILHAHGPSLGACEVIIHSPDHHRWLPFLSAEQAELVMVTTWERYRRHTVPGVGSVVALYNHGREAGASLSHPHGQLYSTRLAAPVMDEELHGAEEAHRRLGACVFCRMADEEVAQQVRLVAQAEEFVALAPYASRQPFECLIIPRRHEADFGRADESDAAALGVFLREVLWRLTQGGRRCPSQLVHPRSAQCDGGLARQLPLASRSETQTRRHRRLRDGDRDLHQHHGARGRGRRRAAQATRPGGHRPHLRTCQSARSDEGVCYRFPALGGSNSVVECNLAKVEVAGSNPVSRSISVSSKF